MSSSPLVSPRSRGSLLAGLVCALVLAISASAAAAPYEPIGEFGSAGAGAEQFSDPQRVAVKESTNQIFVVDRGNDRVQIFEDDGSGTAPGSISYVGTLGAGELADPYGIAIDQDSGAIYVTDAGNARIVKFDSSLAVVDEFGSVGTGGADGEFDTLAVGLAVDPTTSDVLVADRGGRVQRFDADGTFLSAFDGASGGNPAFTQTANPTGDTNGPRDVAVDSAGDIYVADGQGGLFGGGTVEKFDSAGTFIAALGPPLNGTGGVVAVDSASDDAFATQNGGLFNGGGSVHRFNAAGAHQETFAPTGTGILRNGLAINPALARAYLVEIDGFAGTTRVLVFGEPPPQPVPTVTTQPASDVRQSRARLNGTVNPNGGDTTYEFEYGTDTTYGTSVPVPAGDVAGDGGEQAVSEAIEGLDPGTTYHYRLVATNDGGTTEGDDVQFTTLPEQAPTVETGPASDIVQEGAALTGTVDPNGADGTTYEFQYGTDTSYGTSVPVPAGTLGPETDPIDVSEQIENLDPGTTYHYRLVATSDAGTTEGDDVQFDTLPELPPAVVSGPVTNVARTVATLGGTVDPEGADTTYQFEWGTDTSYGNTVPVPPGALGPETDPVSVSEPIEGLEPGRTYHFRLVATSDAGTTEGEDVEFTTAAAPAARGYELVSPADDLPYATLVTWLSRAPVQPQQWVRRTSDDGNRHVFDLDTNGTLPGMVPDGNAADAIVASRGSNGWDWTAPLGDRTDCPTAAPPKFRGLSAAGDQLMLGLDCPREKEKLGPRHPVSGAPLDQETHAVSSAGGSLYRVDIASDTPSYLSGKYDADGPVVRADDLPNYYLGSSPDFSTAYFASPAGLVVDAPDVPGANAAGYIYRRTGDTTTIVTRAPGPDGPLTGAPVPVASNSINRPGAISRDSTAVTTEVDAALLAEDTNGLRDVYQVRGGQVVWASRPTRSPAATPASRRFEGAAEDGSGIVFSTTEQMTDDDTDDARDVYAYDVDADELSRVSVRDSGCTAPAPCDDNADGTGAAANSAANFSTISADGSRVFFVTGDVLDAADGDGTQSLYVREVDGGATTYIAPAGAGRTSASNGTDAGTGTRASLVDTGGAYSLRPIEASADGRTVAFLLASDTALPASRGGTDDDDIRDLYMWREGFGLRRLPQGLDPAANSTNQVNFGCTQQRADGVIDSHGPCLGISEDGRRIAVTSGDPLVPEDTDGGELDVYLVDPADGYAELISPAGDDPRGAQYSDMSRSGDSVFFTTVETLDASRDIDAGLRDVYVARVGGGFPPLPEPPAPCAGDACQPPGPPARGAPPARSVEPVEPDNVAPRPRIRRSLRLTPRPSRRAVRRMGRTGRLPLRVQLTGGGTIRVGARARVRVRVGGRIRTRSRRVARVRRTVRRERANVRVVVRLNRKAKRQLRRNGRLGVRIRVRVSGLGTRELRVVPRRPQRRVVRRSARRSSTHDGRQHG